MPAAAVLVLVLAAVASIAGSAAAKTVAFAAAAVAGAVAFVACASAECAAVVAWAEARAGQGRQEEPTTEARAAGGQSAREQEEKVEEERAVIEVKGAASEWQARRLALMARAAVLGPCERANTGMSTAYEKKQTQKTMSAPAREPKQASDRDANQRSGGDQQTAAGEHGAAKGARAAVAGRAHIRTRRSAAHLPESYKHRMKTKTSWKVTNLHVDVLRPGHRSGSRRLRHFDCFDQPIVRGQRSDEKRQRHEHNRPAKDESRTSKN